MAEIKELLRTSMGEFESMQKEEGWNYELIDGMVMMSLRPAAKHQRINGNIYHELRKLLKGKNCEPIQEIDLVLHGENFIPDLMVICHENLDELTRYEKPPLIAIEIISPSSISRDYFVKRNRYEALGIPEYWIVSPEEKCIMVICFVTGETGQYCDGKMHSFIMPEIVIDLSDVF